MASIRPQNPAYEDFSDLISIATNRDEVQQSIPQLHQPSPYQYHVMKQGNVPQPQRQRISSGGGGGGGGGGSSKSFHQKAPPGHKLCEKCGQPSPVRYPNCKYCKEPFPMGLRKQKRMKAEQALREQQLQFQMHQQQHQAHPQQPNPSSQQHHTPSSGPSLLDLAVPIPINIQPKVDNKPSNAYHQSPSSFQMSQNFDNSADREEDQSIETLTLDESPLQTQAAADIRQITLTNGKQIVFFLHNNIAHLSYPDVQAMIPGNLRQLLGKLLISMDFTPTQAKRHEVVLLINRKTVTPNEITVMLYPAADVEKMFSILGLPVPEFIVKAAKGDIPQETVDPSEIQLDEPYPPVSSWATYKRARPDVPNSINLDIQATSSTDGHFVSPKGSIAPFHPHEGRLTSGVLKQSKLGTDIEYRPIQWGNETLVVMYPKGKEPYVCITELNRKLLQVGTKKCQQRRYNLGIDSIPTTADQVHKLKSLGSLSERIVYTRLLKLQDACELSKSFGILPPQNVVEEWKKYAHLSKDEHYDSEDSSQIVNMVGGVDSPASLMMEDGVVGEAEIEEPIVDDVKLSEDGNYYHPDFVNLDGDNFSEEGVMKQFRYNGTLNTTFTTRHNIHYMTLAELFDHFLQSKGITKVNMTYRMRKLNLRTIRASSWVRLRMIMLGSHSQHIPVCCILPIEDCVKLLKCFRIPVPPIIKKVYLIGDKKLYKLKLVCQEAESFVVKVPRNHTKQFPPVKEPVNQTQMDIIDTKAVHGMMPGTGGGPNREQGPHGAARRCPHCKHLTPVVKKRCQNCKAFLVGLPCPACKILNHNRSSYCWKCSAPLEFRETASAQSPRKQVTIGTKVKMATSSNQKESDSEGGSDDETNKAKVSVPPIRSTVLKSYFPQDGSQKVSQPGARTCGECGQINSNKSKKCFRCSRPLIGRSCPQCGRPNHNHSQQCWKCGGYMPPMKGKLISHGRFKKSRDIATFLPQPFWNENNSPHVSLEEFEKNRAPVPCIRCHGFRASGKFKCGRCGDVFSTKAIFDNDVEEDPPPTVVSTVNVSTPPGSQNGKLENGKQNENDAKSLCPTATQQKKEEINDKEPPSDADLLALGKAIFGSGVGNRVSDMIEVDSKEFAQQLPVLEQQYKDAKSMYDRFRSRHRQELDSIQNKQANLDGLVSRADVLTKKIQKFKIRKSNSKVILTEMPDRFRALKSKLESKSHVLAVLDAHMTEWIREAPQPDIGDDYDITKIEASIHSGKDNMQDAMDTQATSQVADLSDEGRMSGDELIATVKPITPPEDQQSEVKGDDATEEQLTHSNREIKNQSPRDILDDEVKSQPFDLSKLSNQNETDSPDIATQNVSQPSIEGNLKDISDDTHQSSHDGNQLVSSLESPKDDHIAESPESSSPNDLKSPLGFGASVPSQKKRFSFACDDSSGDGPPQAKMKRVSTETDEVVSKGIEPFKSGEEITQPSQSLSQVSDDAELPCLEPMELSSHKKRIGSSTEVDVSLDDEKDRKDQAIDSESDHEGFQQQEYQTQRVEESSLRKLDQLPPSVTIESATEGQKKKDSESTAVAMEEEVSQPVQSDDYSQEQSSSALKRLHSDNGKSDVNDESDEDDSQPSLKLRRLSSTAGTLPQELSHSIYTPNSESEVESLTSFTDVKKIDSQSEVNTSTVPIQPISILKSAHPDSDLGLKVTDIQSQVESDQHKIETSAETGEELQETRKALDNSARINKGEEGHNLDDNLVASERSPMHVLSFTSEVVKSPCSSQRSSMSAHLSPSISPTIEASTAGSPFEKADAFSSKLESPPSTIMSPPVDHESPPAELRTPPVDPESPPAELHTPPVDHESPPAELHTPPVDPESPPAELHTPPVDHESPPAELYTPPVDPESPPAELHTPPVDPESPPADPESPPAELHTPPADPESPPAELHTPPADPESPPAELHTPPADPESPPAELHTPPVHPESPPAELHTPPVHPESPPAELHTPPVHPESPPAKLHSPPVHPESPPDELHNSPVELQGSPFEPKGTLVPENLSVEPKSPHLKPKSPSSDHGESSPMSQEVSVLDEITHQKRKMTENAPITKTSAGMLESEGFMQGNTPAASPDTDGTNTVLPTQTTAEVTEEMHENRTDEYLQSEVKDVDLESDTINRRQETELATEQTGYQEPICSEEDNKKSDVGKEVLGTANVTTGTLLESQLDKGDTTTSTLETAPECKEESQLLSEVFKEGSPQLEIGEASSFEGLLLQEQSSPPHFMKGANPMDKESLDTSAPDTDGDEIISEVDNENIVGHTSEVDVSDLQIVTEEDEDLLLLEEDSQMETERSNEMPPVDREDTNLLLSPSSQVSDREATAEVDEADMMEYSDVLNDQDSSHDDMDCKILDSTALEDEISDQSADAAAAIDCRNDHIEKNEEHLAAAVDLQKYDNEGKGSVEELYLDEDRLTEPCQRVSTSTNLTVQENQVDEADLPSEKKSSPVEQSSVDNLGESYQANSSDEIQQQDNLSNEPFRSENTPEEPYQRGNMPEVLHQREDMPEVLHQREDMPEEVHQRESRLEETHQKGDTLGEQHQGEKRTEESHDSFEEPQQGVSASEELHQRGSLSEEPHSSTSQEGLEGKGISEEQNRYKSTLEQLNLQEDETDVQQEGKAHVGSSQEIEQAPEQLEEPQAEVENEENMKDEDLEDLLEETGQGPSSGRNEIDTEEGDLLLQGQEEGVIDSPSQVENKVISNENIIPELDSTDESRPSDAGVLQHEEPIAEPDSEHNIEQPTVPVADKSQGDSENVEDDDGSQDNGTKSSFGLGLVAYPDSDSHSSGSENEEEEPNNQPTSSAVQLIERHPETGEPMRSQMSMGRPSGDSLPTDEQREAVVSGEQSESYVAPVSSQLQSEERTPEDSETMDTSDINPNPLPNDHDMEDMDLT